MNQTKFYILTILVFCAFIKCTRSPNSGTIEHIREITSGIDDTKLRGVETIADDWMTYGGNYQEDRYSLLNQINKSTIDSLGLVWSINLGTTRGLEATPLVVDGIMYLTGTWIWFMPLM